RRLSLVVDRRQRLARRRDGGAGEVLLGRRGGVAEQAVAQVVDAHQLAHGPLTALLHRGARVRQRQQPRQRGDGAAVVQRDQGQRGVVGGRRPGVPEGGQQHAAILLGLALLQGIDGGLADGRRRVEDGAAGDGLGRL